ncbi:ATP-binding protein [Streptomyces sp. NPDC093546]|uniref:ATP-binding protein n=1 Tax=Streptomyces sp. NPDC093546 TaxID=3366040 RepID=UPI0037F88DD3
MPPTLRTALCPVTVTFPRPPARPPRKEALALSLTLPGEPHCARVARESVRAVLRAHRLAEYADDGALVANELLVIAGKLTPGKDVYLSLRYRAGALRFVVWDQHPRHRDPEALTLCEERRRRQLWLLDFLVHERGGDWGVGEAQAPGRGTKSWVSLPLAEE